MLQNWHHVTGRVPVYYMWRREPANGHISMRQQGRRVGADGPLPIGAGNVNGLPWEVDMLQKKAYALEAWLDHMAVVRAAWTAARCVDGCFETSSHCVPAEDGDSDQAVGERRDGEAMVKRWSPETVIFAWRVAVARMPGAAAGAECADADTDADACECMIISR